MNLDELKELLRILDERQVAEFELEEAGTRLRIKKTITAENQLEAPTPPGVGKAPSPPPSSLVRLPTNATEEASAARPEAAPQPDGLTAVKSPIVGTFYRSPDPNSPSFVNVGDHVKVGQVLCIIEAMKLMNEIESEVAGEIVKIHPESGQSVQYGDPLFAIKPSR